MLTETALQEYAAAGTVKQNYVNILLMLLRLRQACDHPHLVRGYESTSNWKSSLEMAKKLPMERQQELLICLQSCSAICALCNVSESLHPFLPHCVVFSYAPCSVLPLFQVISHSKNLGESSFSSLTKFI
jgi:SNF2 family DNA or RNA helicase